MADKSKTRPPKDRRTPEKKREDSLRNSAAIRGITYEELLSQIEKHEKKDHEIEHYE
ncbi:hypothetical protein AU106_gp018 [Sinorhizobium phage phiM9]|uniref:Uncharacterized protein n=1 Tax=Sinorhizobium phage phiM9 TaxID=1636182 RepID=A0A0F6TGJ6_9CAUD|nr:hypothetical protein AU106_gp018 [Sinorhizobium phage phiM9]AKE44649.1 hypothetical protein Sm_phiM9_019 [Sinorhizobium phage phiM9]